MHTCIIICNTHKSFLVRVESRRDETRRDETSRDESRRDESSRESSRVESSRVKSSRTQVGYRRSTSNGQLVVCSVGYRGKCLRTAVLYRGIPRLDQNI